eukprot:16444894-Heterocapsa_arctica.AAC.1
MPPRPDTERDREAVRRLLSWLREVLDQVPKISYAIIALDANARVGSIRYPETQAIGPFQPAQETWSGQLLRKLLEERGLVLINTWSSEAAGSTYA